MEQLKLFTEGTISIKDGREFTKLIGGFGENNPIIAVKQIADLMEYDVKVVNQTINRNIGEFTKEEGYIKDLKEVTESDYNLEVLKSLGYTNMAISKAKNIYILSEAGFLLYLKFAEGDKAVLLYKDFIEDYFKTKAENKEYKKTLEEELVFIKKEKATTIGMIAMEENESKRIELSIQLERYSNRISEIKSTLDNRGLRIALENQAKLAESKSKYVNQSEFGSRFNNKIGAKTIGKLLRIVGLGKKSNNDNGRTIPYQNFVPDYAINIINNNKELDYDVAYKWNYNKCSKFISQWLLDNDYHDKFYGVTDKEELIKFIDDLYNTYINKAS